MATFFMWKAAAGQNKDREFCLEALEHAYVNPALALGLLPNMPMVDVRVSRGTLVDDTLVLAAFDAFGGRMTVGKRESALGLAPAGHASGAVAATFQRVRFALAANPCG